MTIIHTTFAFLSTTFPINFEKLVSSIDCILEIGKGFRVITVLDLGGISDNNAGKTVIDERYTNNNPIAIVVPKSR